MSAGSAVIKGQIELKFTLCDEFHTLDLRFSIVINLKDPEIVGPITGIMLLTITYGGIVSALGHFSMFK